MGFKNLNLNSLRSGPVDQVLRGKKVPWQRQTVVQRAPLPKFTLYKSIVCALHTHICGSVEICQCGKCPCLVPNCNFHFPLMTQPRRRLAEAIEKFLVEEEGRQLEQWPSGK